ncbi:hypothetical protein PHJA_000695800 [Phtheirospermum japonicum]|uniref:Uncharacterized protein n=1 Tax=Phtheirospermum japonicum TaxID=374723 RepID=A0A830BTU8_9LAMI|nr:hypothetical protein PHJA_000695800 [Phtheirospermum japonicum]
MAPPPEIYSGTSTLALAARASAFSFGLVYGAVKLKIIKVFSSPPPLFFLKDLNANMIIY